MTDAQPWIMLGVETQVNALVCPTVSALLLEFFALVRVDATAAVAASW